MCVCLFSCIQLSFGHAGTGNQPQATNTDDNNAHSINESKISRKKKSKITYSTVRLKMQRKFEKFKAQRKRKTKEAGLGIKYSSLNSLESKECKTHKAKLKRLKSVTKTKPKRYEHKDSVLYSGNSSVINPTDQMKNVDLRPLIIEIFD